MTVTRIPGNTGLPFGCRREHTRSMAFAIFRPISGALRSSNREHAPAGSLATLTGFWSCLLCPRPDVLMSRSCWRRHHPADAAGSYCISGQDRSALGAAAREGNDCGRSSDPVGRAELPHVLCPRCHTASDQSDVGQVFNPDRKDHHRGKRKLKRDQ
jgi:hypothetical protein